ncbi:Uncharacterised protein [Salmonella enterica subsp. enterica serovar Typhimurium str. DT104]|nr:Uncharacterised protein [Salmonella enterica subsp. enterica serovar Typhimurium str. DT104]CQQ83057.1 Uncharacterised protein [Salmonella enterica subsp. enterica serovar Typhimurium str. DT104]
MLYAVLHIIRQVVSDRNTGLHTPHAGKRSCPAYIQPDFDRPGCHGNIQVFCQRCAQPCHIAGTFGHIKLIPAFPDQITVTKKRRRPEDVDIFQALALVHSGHTRGKVNLPALGRRINSGFSLCAVIFHQERTRKHVPLLPFSCFQFLL